MAYTLRTKDNALDTGRHADQNESVDNDIYFNGFGTWATWTPVIVGYSADPTDSIYRYMTIGKTVFLFMREGTPGTSDAVNLTYSLPVTAASAGVTRIYSAPTDICKNNGVFLYGSGWGYISPAADDDLLICSPTNGADWNGWTASGDKLFAYEGFTIMYEAA